MKRLLSFAVLCLFALGATAAHAESEPKAKTRPKHLKGEATVRGDKRNVNFDDTPINGATKAPMSSMVSQSRPDKNYDFVKIRLRWHPEMVQSASTLDLGGGAVL